MTYITINVLKHFYSTISALIQIEEMYIFNRVFNLYFSTTFWIRF